MTTSESHRIFPRMHRFLFALTLTACTVPQQPVDTGPDTAADIVTTDTPDAMDAGSDVVVDAGTVTDTPADVPLDCYMGWVCNGQCTSVLNSMQNCGACDWVCRGDYCSQGVCLCDGSPCRP